MERNRKAAIVTGASSGIGRCVSSRLIGLGYRVFGIGREFSDSELLNEENFCPVVLDMLDTDRLCAAAKEIAAENCISVLVNNAGVGYYGLHEELSPKKITEMVRTNLEAPMILTQQLLRHLKKNRGYVIQISSVTAKESSPHGCAYGATKAGIAAFSRSLFDEARKYGLKSAVIYPDMTKTNLYRNADFCEDCETEAYLMPEEVAGAVAYIIEQREGMVVSEIALQPQLHRIRRKQNAQLS